MVPRSSFIKEYRLRAIVVFSFILVIFFIRFWSKGLVMHLGSGPVVFAQTEWVYRLIAATGVVEWLTAHMAVAAVFDALLFMLPLAFMWWLKRRYVWLYLLLVTVYFLLINLVTGHHYHGLVGVPVMCLPFLTKNEDRFNLLWAGARYYLLYIFASAAMWKIARASAFYPEQLSNILKDQQLHLLVNQPGHWRAALVTFLIENYRWAHALLLLNTALQLSFAIGFFTRRFDKGLLTLFLLFVVSNYVVMGIVSAELLVLGFTLLDWRQMEAIKDTLTVPGGVSTTPA